MIITDYKVEGMTCGHCEQAVSTEIKKLNGVEDVRASSATGDVVVESATALDADAVAAAVEEAGYTLVR